MMLLYDLKKLTYVFSFLGVMFFLNSCGISRHLQKQKKEQSFSAEELFMKGQQMKLQQHPSEAIAYFKDFEKEKPQVAAVYFDIARQYNIMDKRDSVLKYARKAASLDSANKWIQQFYAQTLANQGMFTPAARIFHGLSLKEQPAEHFLNREILMWIYAKKYVKALQLLDSLEVRTGTNEKIMLRKQWLYFKMNKMDSAEKEVEKLVALQPSNGAYYAMLARVYSKIKKPHKAIKVYRDLLGRQPKNIYAKLALSVLYKETHQSSKFKKYIKEVFQSPGIMLEEKIDFVAPFLKYVEIDSKEREDALWLSRLLTKVYPTSEEVYVLLGRMYYKCEMNDSAMLQFKKAESLDSSDYRVWRGMMLIYLEQEEVDSLLEVNQTALGLFPENPEVVMIRGMAFYRLKDYKKAASLLQQALQLDIKSMATKQRLFQSLAAVYYRLHKIRKARKYKKMADELKGKREIRNLNVPLK